MKLILWIVPIVIATPPVLRDSQKRIIKGKTVHLHPIPASESISALVEPYQSERSEVPSAVQTRTLDESLFHPRKKSKVKDWQLGRARDGSMLLLTSEGSGLPSISTDIKDTSTMSSNTATAHANDCLIHHDLELDKLDELDYDGRQLAAASSTEDEVWHEQGFTRDSDASSPSEEQVITSRQKSIRNDSLEKPDHNPRNYCQTTITSTLPSFKLRKATKSAVKNVQDELIMEFYKPFDEYINLLNSKFVACKRVNDQIPFNGIPATCVFYSGKAHSKRSYIRLTTTGRRFRKTCWIKDSLWHLIKYLIFEQVAFIQELGVLRQFIGQLQRQFFNWLEEEIFRPQNGGPPVMGRVKSKIKCYDQSAFGPVQLVLLNYLTTERTEQGHHQTACTIIKLWYADCAPSMRGSPFKNDDEFWSFMNLALYSAEETDRLLGKMKYETHPNHHRWPQDESFHIFDLEKISSEALSRVHHLSARKNLSQAKSQFITSQVTNEVEEKNAELVRRVDFLYKSLRTASRYKTVGKTQIRVALVPVVIGNSSKNIGKTEERFLVRLLTKSKGFLPPSQVERRLLVFLKYMENYLVSFLDCLRSEKHVVIPHAIIDMTNWLENKLFEEKDGLPVIGITTKKIEHLDQSCFETIQNYLISYLTNGYSSSELDQAFSYVLGYWFKASFLEIWSKVFVDDKDYWLFMAGILCRYLPSYNNVHRMGAIYKVT